MKIKMVEEDTKRPKVKMTFFDFTHGDDNVMML